jgi:hypothetical protein
MQFGMKFLFVMLVLAAPLRVRGQDEGNSPRWALGIDAGYFHPFGNWAEHRFAGVDLFGAGPTFRGELEFRLKRNLGFALNANYTKLNLGDWENYAASRGERVNAAAAITHFAGLLRWRLHNRAAEAFFIEGGASYVIPRGQESFGGGVYDFDFLKARFGLAAGIGYAHFLGKKTALVLRLSGVLVPAGIKYADGEKRDLIALPITVGVRFGN